MFYAKVSENCPVKAPRDHMLLRMGTEVFKVCPDPDALLPFLIKNNPLMPVVYNHRLRINVNTAGQAFNAYSIYIERENVCC